MKKIVKALSLLLVALLLFSCVSCGEEEKENSKTYKSLREHLMAEGRVVTNFIRDMEFKYGDARINPAINWEFLDESKAINPDEKIVSCDRLVGWILYRVGFTSQPYDHGITVWPMPDWCEDMGFELITNLEELREGDIVFVNPDSKYRPAHVFMCASTMREDGRFLRYDGGSNERLQCVKGTELVAGNTPVVVGGCDCGQSMLAVSGLHALDLTANQFNCFLPGNARSDVRIGHYVLGGLVLVYSSRIKMQKLHQ